MAASKTEGQRHASEALEYEAQLERAMAQSLWEQRLSGSDSEWLSDILIDDEEEQEFDRAEKMAEKAASGESPDIQTPPLYDPEHLGGTTQSEFEGQHGHAQRREKTTQDKTEEEIVLEYVKKQSALEVHHQNEGKGRVTAIEDSDDEELQQGVEAKFARRRPWSAARGGFGDVIIHQMYAMPASILLKTSLALYNFLYEFLGFPFSINILTREASSVSSSSSINSCSRKEFVEHLDSLRSRFEKPPEVGPGLLSIRSS